MNSRQPLNFEIAFEDFDLELLPENARLPGSDAFQTAVRLFFLKEFEPLGGVVTVDFGDGAMEVTWHPSTSTTSLFDRALQALERGRLADAVPYLQALVAVEPKNAAAHYNLGMALSDLGQLEDAQLHLLKAVHLEPENTNALVALGIALYRDGNLDAARRRLEQALAVDPGNGYAHRNLGGILGNLNEGPAAIDHLREAYRLLPDDQQSIFGLAQALESFGSPDDLSEADSLYQQTIKQFPNSDIGELARQARTRLASHSMRRTTPGPRMDAVMYCLGALEKFADMSRDEVQSIAFEIALLGRSGLDVNNPDSRYTLRTMPGDFSGLHLMSLMYVGFQQIAPDHDIGFDLSQEYQTALGLYRVKGGNTD